MVEKKTKSIKLSNKASKETKNSKINLSKDTTLKAKKEIKKSKEKKKEIIKQKPSKTDTKKTTSHSELVTLLFVDNTNYTQTTNELSRK